jgi:hypothetical protein
MVIEWSNLQKEAFQLDHLAISIHVISYSTTANQQFLNDQNRDEFK